MGHTFRIGDLVESSDPMYPLRSGASQYASAVVISQDPLILTSLSADMRWKTTVKIDKLRKIGSADPEVLLHCMRRIDG